MTTLAHLPPIQDLNRAEPAAFVEGLKPLFEAADPLARALLRERPYTSYPALLDRAEALIGTLSPAEQAEVVNAHPRIGASAADVQALSALSYREQGYAAEAAMDQAALARVYGDLAGLNEQYEQRFGFRFVVFVNGRSKAEILDVLRERFERDREAELQTALHDLLAIARDRLRKLGASPSAAG